MIWSVVVGVAVVLVTVLLLYDRWRHQYWQRLGVYAPPGYKFLGHMLHNFNGGGVMRYDFLDKVYKETQDSKMFGLYECYSAVLCVCDPGISQHIFIKDFEYFVDRRSFDFKGTDNELFNDMITNATGSHWKGIRSVLTPTFTSGKMKNMFYLVEEKSNALLQYCNEETRTKSTVDLHQAFRRYTMDVISTCAFGMEINSLQGENLQFTEAAESLFKPTKLELFKGMLFMVAPWLIKLLKISITRPNMQYLANVVQNTIEMRKNGKRRGDFVDLMLDSREDPARDNQTSTKTTSYVLTDSAIIASSVQFILAGFDTTATTMSFAAKLLAKYPVHQERLRQELKERLGQNPEGKLTYQDVMESKYLEGILAEAMRLYPAVHTIERMCTKDYKIPGSSVTVRKGQLVNMLTWSYHRDEKFFPDANEFKPERFFPENKQDIPTGVYMPFGLGPRMCIAVRFAQMEAKLALAQLVLNYNMTLAPGFEDFKISTTPGLLKLEEGTVQIVLERLDEQQQS